MSFSIRYLREVAGEVREAADWYAVYSPRLRQSFRDAFKSSAMVAQTNPGHYRSVHGEFRRVLMKGFPYAIWFRVHDETVVVVCLFHCARNPEGLKRLLQERWKE